MTRRITPMVVLLIAVLVGWMSTSRFVAWGDEVAEAVATMLVYVAPPVTATTGGIDFVECYGCEGLPGTEGFAYGLLALLLAGGPLAFAATIFERRQQQFGATAVPSAWCQTGFVVQGASLAVGSLLVYALVSFAATSGDVVHWSSAAGLIDIFVGVPALFRWRRLQAGSFAAPARPLLKAA